jgi:hypothetical protein
MYYLRARYYNPDEGRFWTMDSEEGDLDRPSTLHLYVYCANDPAGKNDLTGHDFTAITVGLSLMSTLASAASPASIGVENRAWNEGTNLKIDPYATATFRERMRLALRTLVNTPTGNIIVYQAQNFPDGIYIKPGNDLSPSTGLEQLHYGKAQVVDMAPDKENGIGDRAPVRGLDRGESKPGPEEIPPDNSVGCAIVLAHELGHALHPDADIHGKDPIDPETRKITGGLNVREHENPVRLELGQPPRRHYHGIRIPRELQ